VTGMIVGTAFTLFVVPSIYMLVARRRLAPSAFRVKADSTDSLPETDSPADTAGLSPVETM